MKVKKESRLSLFITFSLFSLRLTHVQKQPPNWCNPRIRMQVPMHNCGSEEQSLEEETVSNEKIPTQGILLTQLISEITNLYNIIFIIKET